ncbi:hypothetical protein ACFOYW_16365 [Gryllotalpicola reticulitermitis]|uniref:Uncharacterized protein n=1 Tax=Gryllotalpicola reticulitermitis TaxID=1184153 RepID=A0ABV8Q9E2_9MICO
MVASDGRLDFVDALRRVFATYSQGFGGRDSPLELQSVYQEADVLTVRFRGYPGDGREYGARFDTPRNIGDERWALFVEPESSLEDWAIWGIVCRLVERYDTTDRDALPVRDGASWFDAR